MFLKIPRRRFPNELKRRFCHFLSMKYVSCCLVGPTNAKFITSAVPLGNPVQSHHVFLMTPQSTQCCERPIDGNADSINIKLSRPFSIHDPLTGFIYKGSSELQRNTYLGYIKKCLPYKWHPHAKLLYT